MNHLGAWVFPLLWFAAGKCRRSAARVCQSVPLLYLPFSLPISLSPFPLRPPSLRPSLPLASWAQKACSTYIDVSQVILLKPLSRPDRAVHFMSGSPTRPGSPWVISCRYWLCRYEPILSSIIHLTTWMQTRATLVSLKTFSGLHDEQALDARKRW